MKLLIPVLVLTLLLSVSLSEYYADVSINIDKSGAVSISGLTNHPGLMIKYSTNLTSKSGSNWILNITLNENFSSYVYSISLPRNAAISYIRAPAGFRIEPSINGLNIKGAAENQIFQLVVQYQLLEDVYGSYIIMVVSGVIAFSFLFFAMKKNLKPKKKLNTGDFPERQRKILEIVIKNKKTTLTELLKQIKIPKSSLSRNIDSLVRQGIITSERKGMSKIIKLKQ